MTVADLSGEVNDTLRELKDAGIGTAIGSSSKNTGMILEHIGLGNFFDTVSDRNNIVNSKPHPEIFLKAAKLLDMTAADCLVVEAAGVELRRRKPGEWTVRCLETRWRRDLELTD